MFAGCGQPDATPKPAVSSNTQAVSPLLPLFPLAGTSEFDLLCSMFAPSFNSSPPKARPWFAHFLSVSSVNSVMNFHCPTTKTTRF